MVKAMAIPTPQEVTNFNPAKNVSTVSVTLSDRTFECVSQRHAERTYLYKTDVADAFPVGHSIGWAAALYKCDDGRLVWDVV